jgi:SWI/SNF-related matrix-associated actin-dependent regulator of chromatin subfamily A member 5
MTNYHLFLIVLGHRIKNDSSLVAKACYSVRAVFKIILSGTPMQNNLREIGACLKFLAPNIFTDLRLFEKAFELNQKHNIDRELLDRAHYMLRPFLLRRVKAEVEQKLPPKLETKINCPMTPLQKQLTEFMLFKERSIISRAEKRSSGMAIEDTEGSSSDYRSLMGLVAHLRKAANHPFLFSGIEDVEDSNGFANHQIIEASGKMKILDKLLAKLYEKGHRVVLFSQFTRTLDILCDYLDYRGYRYERLDGSTNRVMREVKISMFNKKNSEYFIFCLSTRAGGEGVNLYTADTVIMFDR